jgi:cyclopropane fatty-acyl-phospholipid synthase-like methyltransferase
MNWKDAPNTGKGDYYIHPSGGTESYKTSGKASAEQVSKYLKKGQKVLEYGCGNGRIMRHISYECEGVDIVPEFVQQANDEGMKASLIKGYDFKPVFDVVYSITVFIHLSKEDGKKALQNIHKALKPGGLALLEIPIYEKAKDPNAWIDVGTWTEKQLRDVCDAIGFEVVELHTNKGEFTYNNVGPNHAALQVLKKKP